MAWLAGEGQSARSHFERAIAGLDAAGRTHASARVLGAPRRGRLLGRPPRGGNRTHGEGVRSAVSRRDRFRRRGARCPTRSDVLLHGQSQSCASARIEFTLDLAEKFDLAEQLSQALNTKAVLLSSLGRKQEAHALMRHALQLGLDSGSSSTALRAYNNLMTFLEYDDRVDRGPRSRNRRPRARKENRRQNLGDGRRSDVARSVVSSRDAGKNCSDAQMNWSSSALTSSSVKSSTSWRSFAARSKAISTR